MRISIVVAYAILFRDIFFPRLLTWFCGRFFFRSIFSTGNQQQEYMNVIISVHGWSKLPVKLEDFI